MKETVFTLHVQEMHFYLPASQLIVGTNCRNAFDELYISRKLNHLFITKYKIQEKGLSELSILILTHCQKIVQLH